MNTVIRPSQREANALRAIQITRDFTRHPEGSVLIAYGDTQVLCTASIEEKVPPFLKGAGTGWLTAEYGMLPRATHTRMEREAAKGKQSGRTQEIQRLIGRSLRAAFDLSLLGERTLQIDCDVLQADGGTRTAAITGAMVAAHDACSKLLQRGLISQHPLRFFVAAVSAGVYRNSPVLDLDYAEDSTCEADVNIVMNEHGDFIEVQGTAEGVPFARTDLDQLLELARHGIAQLIVIQKNALR